MRKQLDNRKIITIYKIDRYCDSLLDCEKGSSTIKKYRTCLIRFMEFAAGMEVDKRLVNAWKAQLLECVRAATVNGAIAALNGFFRYYKWTNCQSRFYRFGHPCFLSEERDLSREEYERLVHAAFKNGNERLALILETICSCGLRISELAFITLEAAKNRRTEVDCKGRIRSVLLPEKLCESLLEYAGRKGIGFGMIFITRTGKPLDRSNVWREMKSLSKAANVKWEKVFPHNLRHLFAKVYYSMEKDLSKLADILGHKDVNTTRIYTRESGSKHRKRLENMGLVVVEYNGISLML